MKKICLFILCLATSFAYAEQTSANTPTSIQHANIAKDSAIQNIQAANLRGDYQTAEKLLAEYQPQYGNDTDYLIEKARYFALNGNPKEALKMVEPLLKKDPKNSTLLDIKNYALAHPTIVAITQNTEFPLISPDTEKANDASDAGHFQQAILLYKQVLSKNPNDKAALIGLARNYLFLNNFKAGEEILAQYKNKFGEDTQYLTEKSRDLALTHHPHQSLDTLAMLLVKDPTNDILLDIKKYANDALKNPSKKIAGVNTISLIESANKAAAFANQTKTSSAYAAAAQQYLNANDPKHARIMINDALSLEPSNFNYLLLKTDIAAELDDQSTLYKTYLQLYKMNEYNPRIVLGLARAAGRLNHLDQSNRLYERYLKISPKDKDAWLEYAYIQSFCGNNRRAIYILDEYHKRFGDSDVYLAERARIVASAARYTESFAIVHELLPRLPKNYDLNFANTTDFFYSNQPIQMFSSFKKVRAIEPNSDETNSLWSFIDTPYRSNIGIEGYHSIDTDSVKIGRVQLNAQDYLSPVTSVIGNVSNERLSASFVSGLNPIQGGKLIHLYGANIGLNHRINSKVALQGLVGGQDASNGEKSFNYEADALMNPSEVFGLNLQVKRAFYDQSARAVSLGVKQNLGMVSAIWQPCMDCTIFANAGYATFTDDNTLRILELHPQIQFLATEKFIINIGVDTLFNKFGRVVNDGYYSPTNYRYGGVITDIYYKYSDNIGYETSIGLGTQHDETFTAWRPADDYSFKAYYGIYQDWYLTFTGAFSTRGRSIANNADNSTYKVYAVDITITRRLG